jgi:hypothetical protein
MYGRRECQRPERALSTTRWRVTEIKVQRKAVRSRKWPWLLLVFIPLIWFALTKAGPAGDDDKEAGDSTKAVSTADSSKKPADAKKPPT